MDLPLLQLLNCSIDLGQAIPQQQPQLSDRNQHPECFQKEVKLGANFADQKRWLRQCSRDECKSVTDRTAVHNRPALAARLFFDSLGPTCWTISTALVHGSSLVPLAVVTTAVIAASGGNRPQSGVANYGHELVHAQPKAPKNSP